MLPIPNEIASAFEAVLKKRAIPVSRHADYRKWLRYFLDFRNKYPLPVSRSEQVRLFVQKLRDKKQATDQQKQAAYVLSLFFESLPRNKAGLEQQHAGQSHSSSVQTVPGSPPVAPRKEERPPFPHSSNVAKVGATAEEKTPQSKSRFNEWRCLERSGSPEWDGIVDQLAAEIKTRHYSRKTLKTYADWVRKFQSYLKNKPPEGLSAADVKAYLIYLAVNCKVAASTQNQAFNAVLFLYRHILKKDFGNHTDIPRAKRSNYIPVVLSRKEIDAVIKHLRPPYDLVIKLLYGCGLRLFESVKLRVKDFNFDAGILTVRGKGNKSRTVPIPQKTATELEKQLDVVRRIHDQDCEAGFTGVFMEDQLEKKYPNAAKEFIWQRFFPQNSLTDVEDTKDQRRYHLHETHVQEALHEAVRRAKLTKRVTSHTFRHSFATHLLQANYDIRTIQEMLGHSDVRTTMIYAHCVRLGL